MASGEGGGRRFQNIRRVPGLRRLEFEVRGERASLVNALRRTVITDVKTVAFAFDSSDPQRQDIKFIKNTGSLHNEFLGERVALVPLHFSREEIRSFKRDSWRFELNVRSAPGDFLDVTTGDIEVVNTGPSETVVDAASVFPADPVSGDRILLTRLKPARRGAAQEVVLEARASVGCGSMHARWIPTCHCVSVPLPDEAAIARGRAAAADLNRFDCIESRHMYVPDAFRFSLESACGMGPGDIFACALEELQERFRALGEDLSSGAARVTAVPSDSAGAGTTSLRLAGESDTVAGVLQQWLMDRVPFVGYYSPHPMERSVILTITLDPPGGEDAAREVLRGTCVEISKHLDGMNLEWADCAAEWSDSRAGRENEAAPQAGRAAKALARRRRAKAPLADSGS